MIEFTEFEGMILMRTLQEPADLIRRRQEPGVPFSRWKYERSANHHHVSTGDAERESVRQELAYAAELETALRRAYPDRDFVISHIPCYAVSFYQLVDDAPVEAGMACRPAGETEWCPNCGGERPYRLLPEPDPEFPWLQWGACADCDHHVVLGDREFRRVIRATDRGPAPGALLGASGPRGMLREDLEYYRRRGKLRPAPLRPPDDPTEILVALEGTAAWRDAKARDRESLRTHAVAQLIRRSRSGD